MSRSAHALPVLAAPAEESMRWLEKQATTVLHQVREQGAVVIRGLRLTSATDLLAVRDALRLVQHRMPEEFVTRDDLGNGVTTPIRWPEDRELCPFQEGSPGLAFPSLVLTACVRLPLAGSEHHVSDMRRLPELLPDELVDRIRRHGWALTRTFHEGFGMSWQQAFAVSTPAELEKVLVQEGIEATWLPSGALRTIRRRAGFVDHPATGQTCWFNDLAFFHTGSLEPDEREIMTRAFGADLPMHTMLGDGTPLSDSELSTVQAGYTAVRREVIWQEGDLIVADNLLTAQGRSVLTGAPQFLVAFAEEHPTSEQHPSPMHEE